MLAGAMAFSTAQAQGQAPARAFREGRILVQPREGLSELELTRAVVASGGRVVGQVRGLGVRIVDVAPQAEARVARALASNPVIKFAELDLLLEPVEAPPNDPRYGDAWHLAKMGVASAWDHSYGDGVTVAILDTGVDSSHPDLVSNLVPGWNSANGSSDTSDIYGHGTKVAGVVAAVTDNAFGVASIARTGSIMPIRITNRSDGLAYTSDIAAGLTWAADNGARVANVSFDVGGSSTVANAAQYMKNKGGVVFHAAGNSGGDKAYPSYDAHISVGATTSGDGKASFSSTGNHLDMAAPGVGIWTTTRGGGFGAPNGTSFSSPAAAAVAALILSANPGLTPDEVEAALKSTAVDLGDPGWDPTFGHGRVDAAAAVALAADARTGNDTSPPSVAIVAPESQAVVQGLVPVDVVATDDFGVARVDLYADNVLVASDASSPYRFTWDSTERADGGATLAARAYDAAANEGRSANTSVEVMNNGNGGDETPPEVFITSPSDGATVSGNITLSARASDASGVSEVRILVDGRLRCAGAPSVQCGWNTRKASAGPHTISATAKDTVGNTAGVSIGVTVGSPGGGGSKGGGKKK
jgi:hypothetical protein